MDLDTQRYACLRVELEKKVRALPGLISTDNQACFSFPPVLTPLSRPEGVDRHRAESNGQILGLPAITPGPPYFPGKPCLSWIWLVIDVQNA